MTAKANLLYQGQATGVITQVYTASLNTEITRIVVCNTAGATTFTICHDDNATTYNATTALYFGAAIGANATIIDQSEGDESGITLKNGGGIAISAGIAAQVTFSIYGTTQDTQGILATGSRQ